jgi:hypothetical protein
MDFSFDGFIDGASEIFGLASDYDIARRQAENDSNLQTAIDQYERDQAASTSITSVDPKWLYIGGGLVALAVIVAVVK